MESSGMKRKYTENSAITAKAEMGSLRVKIMKKQRYVGGASMDYPEHQQMNGFRTPNASPPHHSPPFHDPQMLQQFATQQQQPQDASPSSPPKPRPNRKHVPIFYQNPNALQLNNSKIMMNRHSTAPSLPEQQQQQPSSFQSQFQQTQEPPQYQQQPSPFPHQQFPHQPPPQPNSKTAAMALDQFAAAPITRDMLNELSANHHPGILFGHQHLPTNMPSLQQQLSNTSNSNNSQSPNLNGFSTLSQHLNSNDQNNPNNTSFGDLRGSEDHSFSGPDGSSIRGNGAFQALQYAVDSHMASAAMQRHPLAQHQKQGRPQERDQARECQRHDQEQEDSMMEDDLGPPPSAPPSFAMQNSLMGGGIEMQPVISNVNSRNFDWARRPPGMSGVQHDQMHLHSSSTAAAAAAIASATTSASTSSAPVSNSASDTCLSSSFSGPSCMMSDVETTRPRSNSFPNYLLEPTSSSQHNSQGLSSSSSFHNVGHAFSAPSVQQQQQ